MTIELTDEIRDLIDGALMGGAPMILASVDPQGRPRLTFRGSIQTFSSDQIGFWARNPEGSTMANIAANPNVAMMFRNPTTRAMLQLQGRARVAEGEDRERVFANAPEVERKADPEKKGVGVIVDLDRLDGLLGFDAERKPRFVRMVRD